MPSLSSRDSGMSSIGPLLTLEDERAGSRVEIAPARGALVTSFAVGGRELLYMEPATLADTGKNVRGGIPVLFPSPGRLEDDRFQRAGRRGTMKQHGFARNLPWQPSATAGSEASVTLTLVADAQTRALFPWEFEFALTLALEGMRLSLGLHIGNPGDAPLPCAFGFHPYFRVANKREARIDTRAKRAFDNVAKAVVPFDGFDFGLPEIDLYLLDHGSTESALQQADGSRIALRASSEFTRWVVWSVQDKPYICLEPWSAPPNALNTGECLVEIAPGAAHDAFVALEFFPSAPVA